MDRPSKASGSPLNIIVIDEVREEEDRDPFGKLRKYSTNLFNQELYEDDQFKLPDEHLAKGIVKRRLRDIFLPNTPISELNYTHKEVSPKGFDHESVLHRPTYLSEMRMFPEWHYLTLIEPKTINEQGYYHVAVVQNGRIMKMIIDDCVYYDEARNQIVAHPFHDDKPWVHILLKAWAKVNGGYERLDDCEPFEFVKTFTFPDWSIFNPGLETLETIISKIGPANQKDFFYIARTKSDPNVGLFGLIPNCCSYLLTGYYQEYGNIFLKIRSLVGGKWNGCSDEPGIELPSDPIVLAHDEFIIPLKAFINTFHLIYFTINKYARRESLQYNKYTISLDARESKASFIGFEVAGDNLKEKRVSLNFYFPSVKVSDFGNSKGQESRTELPPSCKICIGRCLENLNLEGSITYAESLRENILKNQEGYFLNPSNSRYQFVKSDYFKGYANETTYHLKLKPGKYIIRLKIEKLLPEYRALLNFTSNEEIAITEQKLTNKEQTQFFSEVLSNKARKEEKNVIYPFPHKKQSWVMVNDDFQTLGYGTIVFQTGKNDNYMMIINLDIKRLKEGGYRIKDKADLSESKHEIRLREGESIIFILKKDLEYRGERTWPPSGIFISYEILPSKKREKTR